MSRPDFGSLVTALAGAAEPYIIHGSTIELARNVAQTLWSNSETGYIDDAADVAHESIVHRANHGWLDTTRGDAKLCADAMAAAWGAWIAPKAATANAIETCMAQGHPLTVIRVHGLYEAQCDRCSGAGCGLHEALAALETELTK